MDIKETAKIICDALEAKKGENVIALDISRVTVIADYFIIANGTNPSQITALVDSVTEELGKVGVHPKCIEGVQNASWILMDYGDIIAHIFSKEDREIYNIEKIWADCEKIEF